MVKIGSVVWSSDVGLLRRACEDLGIDLLLWTHDDLKDAGRRDECLKSLEDADIIILHPSHEWMSEHEWMGDFPRKDKPVISLGYNLDMSLSNVPPEVVLRANAYFTYGGYENVVNMLKFIMHTLTGAEVPYEPPKEYPWQGIYHPDAECVFDDVASYLKWYDLQHFGNHDRRPMVGILFYRTYWLNGDLSVVDALIREFERSGTGVIPVFSMGMGDRDAGAKTGVDVIREFFMGHVDAIVNLQPVFAASENGVSTLKKVDVPVFHPLILYHKTESDWRGDSHGLSAAEVGWSVAMPEFEGLIEPLVAGVKASSSAQSATAATEHVPLEERVRKVVRRVNKWIALRMKPKSERKVAFILHNKPCASVEATVGSASHLDALESVSRILKRLRDEGYAIEEPPEDGKALIDEIMRRKAISEFRWTTVDEIVAKGGALYLSGEEYERWFNSLDEEVRKKVCDVWGRPPGNAMVYDGKIVITGIRYGNAIVCVQPKRGCAGARCDGHVCKILHDPETPPTHQYLATYHYIDRIFGADVIVHVGTHGNLEFLPGKSVGLSECCFPDIAIGDVPHLYIYNADNPPEGTIAKRRSYATLIDHLQAVLTESGLYGDLKALDDLIDEYRRIQNQKNTERAHALRNQIMDMIRNTRIYDEIRVYEDFNDFLNAVHEALSQIYDSQIPEGMHVFGETPEGAQKENFIYAVLRQKFREAVRKLLQRVNVKANAKMNAQASEEHRDSNAFIDSTARKILHGFLSDDGDTAALRSCEDCEEHEDEALKIAAKSMEAEFSELRDAVREIAARLDATDEMGALMHGFDAGYIEPGASGLITKGKTDILPTGRNFYSLDPFKIPTKAAWEVGKKLADAMLRRYEEEKGEFPENVAMYWMASDIMWADGEQLAQIMYLIGVEPVWDADGRVVDFRIIPAETLGRPRIDVTVRVSAIIRDCFYNCIELLDRAFREVSSLDEPTSLNFLRKHAIENENKCEDTHARIFSSKPGTYGSGVNLAVYASAWNTQKDLTEIFIYWNGYAYGDRKFGIKAHKSLLSQLKTVSVTFNKTTTDEYDILGCCCYFSTHGGLTAAAREISGKDVIALYGDTRSDNVEVRTLASEIRRVVRAKLLNPKWIEGMKKHGYSGASEISKRIGRVYGWEASTEEVSDWIFDEIARTFVLDKNMRKFFEGENPWALEEIGRRLIEAYERGLWKASEDVIDGLRAALLEVEGWMEEKIGVVEGEFQGGSIDVVTKEEVEAWKKKYEEILRE
ncbi:MAG: cobaltochelatase subunit CobN [Canidatus Methanoxibalbensis ujae]|nr:cobaltochelatase subunit CobN [Candidatus Methanoxibalbensis ujae]